MTIAPEPTVVHTACTLDCPDACSLAVTVQDGRIVKVDAAPENPLTDGWICSKVRKHARRVHAPERVTTPLVRVGAKGEGRFEPATWDAALALIADRIRGAIDRKGPDSVVAFTYNSSAAGIERESLSEAVFESIGATVIEHTICAHTMGASWDSVFDGMPSADPNEVVHSKLVVVWGANPTVSNTHFPPLVQRAVDGGAKLVVIDPRRTAMAARADLHLPILPGTDAALAYAVANLWLGHGQLDREFMAAHAEGAEEFLVHAREWALDRACRVTGLAEDDIRTLAEWWGTTRPSMLRIGWGPERNANGGASCRAVLALPVLGGHFGVPGSGVIGSVSAGAVDGSRRWPDGLRSATPRRTLPLHQVGTWMAPGTDDPCEVLVVQGANPVVMCPDTDAVVAAFERDDVFTVVHEQVLTDTTRYADVVLPATTSFEIDDVTSSYGSYFVSPVRKVIEPVGESRSNDQFGAALAEALGLDIPLAPVDVACDDPGPRIAPAPGRQFVDVHPRGGRARLVDPEAGLPRYQPVDRSVGTLTLISPATSKLVNSMFGEFQSPAPSISLHPDDAMARGLVPGREVRVTSQVGSIVVPLEVRDDLRPGVAFMAKGVWLRHHADGRGVNALTPATGDPLVNGACFNDTFVTVEPA